MTSVADVDFSLRQVAQIGASLQVPTAWAEITEPADGVVAAWAPPVNDGFFRSNAVLTEDHVGATTWELLARQTWEFSEAMLVDARLLEESLSPSEGLLSRWMQHRLDTTSVVLHQVLRRLGSQLITVSITVPVMTLPDAVDVVSAIGASLHVDGGTS